MQKLLLVVLVLALGGGGAYYYLHRHAKGSAELRLRTGKVERGQVIEGVAASGQVQPFLLVQVGTQVSGVVEKLYKDWNDKVKAGEVVALIDSRRFVANVMGDVAGLGQARANVQATRAKLVQAERDLVRNRQLAEKRLVADSDLDAAVALADTLRAQLDVNAAVVSQSLAQLEGDEINLKYCTITSPVDGVVVSRNVDVGQTVAASFNTPTLFQIANDLTKVQVQASVPEAEIGRIHDGQHAPFRVDAYPDVLFEGVVSQIRLASTTVNNVVTYTVLIDAENPRGQLFPGMTANATFEVAKCAPDSLLVPVAALRFKPSDDIVEATEAATPGEGSGDAPGKPDGGKAGHGDKPGEKGDKKKGERKARPDRGRVWVKSGAAHVRAIAVKVGISDGIHTAVEPLKEGLEDGTEVVLSLAPEEEAAATNPFMPSMMRPGGGRPGGGR